MSNALELNVSRKIEDQGIAKRFLDLMAAVDKERPRGEDLHAISDMLQKTPDLWRVFGDLGEMAGLAVIDNMAVKQKSVRLSTQQGFDALRRDLGYAASGVLEQMVIDECCITWADLHAAQMAYSYDRGEQSLAQGLFHERRLNSLQRRHLRACESLARVRRLLRPVIGQLNIAEKQLNVAGLEPNPSRKAGE